MSHNWSSHETASSSAECSRDKPPFSFVRGQDTTTWDIVWVSRDHCCRGRSKPGCRIVGSHTRWELTTWADFQLCLHRLLTSTGCKSSHNGFLDVSRSNGGLSISGWIGQLSCLMVYWIHVVFVPTYSFDKPHQFCLSSRPVAVVKSSTSSSTLLSHSVTPIWKCNFSTSPFCHSGLVVPGLPHGSSVRAWHSMLISLLLAHFLPLIYSLVPHGRLSWLPINFWLHINLQYTVYVVCSYVRWRLGWACRLCRQSGWRNAGSIAMILLLLQPMNIWWCTEVIFNIYYICICRLNVLKLLFFLCSVNWGSRIAFLLSSFNIILLIYMTVSSDALFEQFIPPTGL